jgi:hypothetical protein
MVSAAPAGEVQLADQIGITDSLSVTTQRDSEANEARRRAQLEVALNDAAEWGWHIARMNMFQEFPHPVVEWDEAGNPTIVYGSTDAARFEKVQQAAAAVAMVSESSLTIGQATKPAVAMESTSSLNVGKAK